MGKYKAEQIASWFLVYNEQNVDDEPITNLKLQKLLYYAQGCYLALTDNCLFAEDIIAWEHGPVVKSVYYKYNEHGKNGIPVGDTDFDAIKNIDGKDYTILEEVYKTFGQYSAWKLRNMTHDEAPWQNTKQNDIIDIDLIKDYFVENYITE